MNKKGFTLVELLIVLVIFGMICVLGCNTIDSLIKRGRQSQAEADIQMMSIHITDWYNDGNYNDETYEDLSSLSQYFGIKFKAKFVSHYSTDGGTSVYTTNYTDPWNNNYELVISKKGYAIVGSGPNTKIDSINNGIFISETKDDIIGLGNYTDADIEIKGDQFKYE